MGFLSKVSDKQVDEMAKSLAQTVAKRYPPALDKSAEKKISVNRITKILEDTYERAIEFHRENRLGAYKKARLGNSFRWELKDLGYSEKFVEIATEGLVVYLTSKAQAKEG